MRPARDAAASVASGGGRGGRGGWGGSDGQDGRPASALGLQGVSLILPARSDKSRLCGQRMWSLHVIRFPSPRGSSTRRGGLVRVLGAARRANRCRGVPPSHGGCAKHVRTPAEGSATGLDDRARWAPESAASAVEEQTVHHSGLVQTSAAGATFFRISRSDRSLAFSRRSRVSSARSAAVSGSSPDSSGTPRSAASALTQLPNVVSLIDRSRATAASLPLQRVRTAQRQGPPDARLDRRRAARPRSQAAARDRRRRPGRARPRVAAPATPPASRAARPAAVRAVIRRRSVAGQRPRPRARLPLRVGAPPRRPRAAHRVPR